MKTYEMTWAEAEKGVLRIALQLAAAQWKPEIILGPTRGGLVPGVMLSHLIDVPFVPTFTEHTYSANDDLLKGKRLLFIDDINDTGRTIGRYYDAYGFTAVDFKVSVLVNNTASEAHVDFFGSEFNKVNTPLWYVFPWEQITSDRDKQ